MKIFNAQPISVNEYIYNGEHLTESQTNWGYSSGFEITGEKVGVLNIMYISFEIIYHVGSTNNKEIITHTGPGKYSVAISFEEGEDIFISYKSSCQFNFESEGYNADITSLTDFLRDYQTHTRSFFNQYGHKPLIAIEEETRKQQPLLTDAEIAIENLRANNMYEF
ncbi:hypothetical protein [Pedobacter alluvionis]|uniref:Uncharacterized protein n=1 Tax=Pedobacter alluvionis TaxID=475253 RepID=A0A497XWX2_9SPHI|nr:hypothetical protein [Pedobacter alluvionis]RLJ72952.1 hypothetical protein BCL90_4603 [Pedobacter alluvionis]TFB29221.1 hypothetical protein E3V97_19425 [Pedobacter alluvionis]